MSPRSSSLDSLVRRAKDLSAPLYSLVHIFSFDIHEEGKVELRVTVDSRYIIYFMEITVEHNNYHTSYSYI